MKRHVILLTGLLSIYLSVTNVRANGLTRMSEGSTTASMASTMLVGGSVTALAGDGKLIVTSLETVGESTLLTLKSSAEAGAISLRVPAAIIGTASVGVGTTVQALAGVTGHSLIASGKMIGFVPNEAGKSLIYHSQRRGNR